GGGQGAQNVVGLPARPAHLHKAQFVQQLFQHRHLLGQFLGHAVAGGLVAVVGFMAGGGGARVPGDGYRVGRMGGEQVEQDVLEAEDRVGVAAILRRQQLDAEKGAVDQAVAVQYHQFHRKSSFGAIYIWNQYTTNGRNVVEWNAKLNNEVFHATAKSANPGRSEERRVGKERRSRWKPYD